MRYSAFVVIVLMCLVTGWVAWAEPEYGAGSERVQYIKDIYDFQNWPGKDGPVRDGFQVTAGMLPATLRIGQVSPSWPHADRRTAAVSVSRDYRITTTNGDRVLTINLIVAETSAQAQEPIADFFAMCSIPQPPLVPRGAKCGLHLGDVCFGGVRSVLWTRDNIYVRVRAKSKEMYPFVGPVARALDEAISKRATYEAYAECKSRPVITSSTRVSDPEERRRLPDGWDLKVEAKDPNGEKLEYTHMNFAGQTIPVVVNESNLLTFPPQFAWVEEISKASSKFQRIYLDWQEAKQAGDTDAVSKNYRAMADLGMSILPALIQKIREGETDLLALAEELTEGKAETEGASPEEKIESCVRWWQEDSSEWYRRIERQYQPEPQEG